MERNLEAPQSVLDLLSSISYFSDLNSATRDALALAALRQEYAVNEVVFLEGDPCTGLFIVQEGWLKVTKVSHEGREQVLRFAGPGDVVNEVGVLAGARNPANVISLEPATVWLIHRDTILQVLEDHPHVARRVAQNLARRVLHLVSLVEDLSLHTVEARLARLLLDQAEEETLRRRRWATQAEMAARLGTVLDVLNRALHVLANENLIEVERRRIRILDRDGLRKKAMVE